MKGDQDGDRAIEPLLREPWRDTDAAAGCIDAESLAAWSEGTLSPEDARELENHLSRCPRCQSMLAAFARADAAAPAAAAEPFRDRWRLRWLVPAAALAAAVAIWVGVPDGHPEAPAALESSTALPAAGADQPAAPPAVQVAPPGVPIVPGQTGAAAAFAPRGPRESVAAPAARGTVDRQANALAETDATARNAPLDRTSVPDAPRPLEKAAGPAAARVMGGPQASALQSATAPARPIEVRSPDGVHRWRADPVGLLQYSPSAGSNWTAVSTAVAGVTAGASPAGSICWFVGRGGSVWLTTDGTHVERHPLLDPVDLVSVRALDALRASVFTADGRAFATQDGGTTWITASP